jgi:hypothetical protein
LQISCVHYRGFVIIWLNNHKICFDFERTRRIVYQKRVRHFVFKKVEKVDETENIINTRKCPTCSFNGIIQVFVKPMLSYGVPLSKLGAHPIRGFTD